MDYSFCNNFTYSSCKGHHCKVLVKSGGTALDLIITPRHLLKADVGAFAFCARKTYFNDNNGIREMCELIIGNKNYSSWSLRPWLVLKKLGLEFKETRIPLSEPDSSKQLQSRSPSGKVPVLVDNGIVVWDSLSICEYLAQQHQTLWPANTSQRALARSISSEMHSGFSALREELPMNCRANRKLAISATCQADINRIESIWTGCLEHSDGPWLFGEFCIADAMFAPVVSRFNSFNISLNPICTDYMRFVLDDQAMKNWYQAAHDESEVINHAEVGTAIGK